MALRLPQARPDAASEGDAVIDLDAVIRAWDAADSTVAADLRRARGEGADVDGLLAAIVRSADRETLAVAMSRAYLARNL